VGITVAAGCGVLGAAQALKSKINALNRNSLVFIVFLSLKLPSNDENRLKKVPGTTSL
jgi:hypothetical protein